MEPCTRLKSEDFEVWIEINGHELTCHNVVDKYPETIEETQNISCYIASEAEKVKLCLDGHESWNKIHLQPGTTMTTIQSVYNWHGFGTGMIERSLGFAQRKEEEEEEEEEEIQTTDTKMAATIGKKTDNPILGCITLKITRETASLPVVSSQHQIGFSRVALRQRAFNNLSAFGFLHQEPSREKTITFTFKYGPIESLRALNKISPEIVYASGIKREVILPDEGSDLDGLDIGCILQQLKKLTAIAERLQRKNNVRFDGTQITGASSVDGPPQKKRKGAK